MGISIYYTACRPQSLSVQEELEVESLVDRYSLKGWGEHYYDQTGEGWDGQEEFGLYDETSDWPDALLAGSTRLPTSSEDEFWTTIQHWCRLLTELRRLLPDAHWMVHIDDYAIQWDEEKREYDPSHPET